MMQKVIENKKAVQHKFMRDTDAVQAGAVVKERSRNIAKYIVALSSLIEGTLQPVEFEIWFLAAYKSEPAGMPADVFLILDRFSEEVDAYCSDAGLRDELSLDEVVLIDSAKNALRELKGCSLANL